MTPAPVQFEEEPAARVASPERRSELRGGSSVVALVDNGSLEPAAHRLLRETAADLSRRTGVSVEAVSWKHSDRIGASRLDPPAWTLAPWFRRRHAEGKRGDLCRLAAEAGGAPRIRFCPGLFEAGVLPAILASQVRRTMGEAALTRPVVLLVDHGGPAPQSAAVRDATAAALAADLAGEVARVVACSMESPEGAAFAFNRPLFADALETASQGDASLLVAPLFLAPGRHAGPDGDLARIARAKSRGRTVIFTPPVGAHPLATAALARSLEAFLHEFTH